MLLIGALELFQKRPGQCPRPSSDHVPQHTDHRGAPLAQSNENLTSRLGKQEGKMHVLEEEKGLLIAEMAEKLAQGTHAKEAVDALSERVSAQALALRTRQEELTARTTELLEANDKLSAMQATEERASEAENRLLVALAAINAKDVTMRHAEAQIKELQGQLELKQQETARRRRAAHCARRKAG